MADASSLFKTRAAQLRVAAAILCIISLAITGAALDRVRNDLYTPPSAISMAVAASVIGFCVAVASLFSLYSDYHSRYGARFRQIDTMAILVAILLLLLAAGGLFFFDVCWQTSIDSSFCSLVKGGSYTLTQFMTLFAALAFAMCIVEPLFVVPVARRVVSPVVVVAPAPAPAPTVETDLSSATIA